MLGFSLVAVTAIVVIALLANNQVSSQFRRLVAQEQLAGSPLPAQLADYYGQHGSWEGVAALLDSADTNSGHGMMGGGRGMRGGHTLSLGDRNGMLVYPSATGEYLDQADLDLALPINWQGQTVGYLLMHMPGHGAMMAPQQHFLDQINQILLQAGLIAAGLSALLGLLIARGLTTPLDRLATAARRIAHGDLEQRVAVGGSTELAALGESFNAMAANLQQAEQARRTMVADIAHELRTPLSVIQGNLQAILDGVYPLERDEIAVIHAETILLSRLVSDLRDLAQIEAGQLSLTLQSVALGPLLEQVQAAFGEQAAAKQITLQTWVPKDLPVLCADTERVQQILRNLISNALRHTPAGGTIRVQATQMPPDFRPIGVIHSAKPGLLPAVVVSVCDSGSGIIESDLPHVFERFWRADPSRSRERGGSGLGLAIAAQLVEAQGGQIGVASTPGQGSHFWFTLPIAT